MNTIRELIILEFIARAAVIRSTGSPQAYATDIGATVFRARMSVDPGELPCTVVFPQPEESENKNGLALHAMAIKIEGIAAFGDESSSIVSERMLGDLIKAFTSPAWDRRRPVASPASPVTYLDPYAESIIYQGGGTYEYPDDGKLTVGTLATFMITYWTAIGDPYNQ
jgi:hypothetical protein